MRFVLGPIPRSQTQCPLAAGWTPLPSPATRWLAPQAAIGMGPCLLLAGWAIQHAAGELPTGTFLLVLLLPALLIPTHELMHVAGYLVNPRSPLLITGIWPTHGIWYVIYNRPLPRWRVQLMLVAPCLALSVIPSLVALTTSTAWRWAILYLVAMHSALCVGDLLTMVRIWHHSPRGAWLHNQQWTTYWSPRSPQHPVPAAAQATHPNQPA